MLHSQGLQVARNVIECIHHPHVDLLFLTSRHLLGEEYIQAHKLKEPRAS